MFQNYNQQGSQNPYPNHQYPYSPMNNSYNPYYNIRMVTSQQTPALKDNGPEPYVVNIEEAAEKNNNFRTTLWTGSNLQLTIMSLKVGEDIGLELHPNTDQFIRIEEGQGLVMMGNRQDNLTFQRSVSDDHAFIIPAGVWHNLVNTGTKPLKLYSIYAPAKHPAGTVHPTKADAMAAKH